MKYIILILITLVILTALVPPVLADEGTFTMKWGETGMSDGEFYDPYIIAVDRSGNIYVKDYFTHRIQKFTSDGIFITKWGEGGTGDGQFKKEVGGIAVDTEGNVYVVDHDNYRIQKFTSDGKFILKWGSEGNGDGQFYSPRGIALDEQGNVYVVDGENHRIQKFTGEGKFITKWETWGTGDGELNNPILIAIDSSGKIYITDLSSIYKFTSDGKFITKWLLSGVADDLVSTVGGIAINTDGTILVSDVSNNHIEMFTSDGKFISKWGTEGIGDGQFHSPYGIAIDKDGNIYVADTGNNRIQKFRPQTASYNLLLSFGFILLVGLGAGLLVKNRNQKIQSPIQMKNEGRPQKKTEQIKTDIPESLPIQTPIIQDTVPIFPRELLSRYNPIELVGEGGFAKVFKVKRISDGQIVAVKIPRIDEKTSSILMNEVAAWYHLNHPNIIKLNNSNLLPILHIEMEYVEGIEVNGKRVRDLDELQKPVSQEQALKTMSDIARGLKYAHEKGIYHHDLKPLNVLITADFIPKIADFGLSKISSRSSMMADKEGYSPMYAAPEQLDSEHYGNPDQRTDLYHLGLIFYELLTGRLPYEGSSHVVTISKILLPEIAPAKLASVNPDLKVYDPVMAKLIAKRMEERFQNVSEFQNALESVHSLNKERTELLEDLKGTKESLKNSTGKEEIRRLTNDTIRKSIRIALLHAQLQDRVELINALNEIRLLTSHHREELDTAIDQVQYMIAEDLPLGKEWIDQLRILLGKIEMQG